MEAPLEHFTFEHRKIPESMDPSNVYTYDSYSGLECMGFLNSPTAIGTIVTSFFLLLLILLPFTFLTMISLSRYLCSLFPPGLNAHRLGLHFLHLC